MVFLQHHNLKPDFDARDIGVEDGLFQDQQHHRASFNIFIPSKFNKLNGTPNEGSRGQIEAQDRTNSQARIGQGNSDPLREGPPESSGSTAIIPDTSADKNEVNQRTKNHQDGLAKKNRSSGPFSSERRGESPTETNVAQITRSRMPLPKSDGFQDVPFVKLGFV